MLLPVVIVLVLSLLHVDVKRTITISGLVGMVIAVLVQHFPVSKLPALCFSGFSPSDTTIAKLMSGGNFLSMLRVYLIVGISSYYSGMFEGTGFLNGIEALMEKLGSRITPYDTTLLTSIVTSAISCNQTLNQWHTLRAFLVLPPSIPVLPDSWHRSEPISYQTIDGTKIEANANRYTFVWRGTLNYHLAGLLDTIDSPYEKYNVLIDENEYGIKYDIPHAHMFVIEGMEKVRDIIEKNRKRKLTKHKKLSNNTVIEIDNCSPLEILKLQQNLLQIAEQEQITFVCGKGKKKPEIQQLYEELEACGERLMGYKECFEIMGTDRNSYSKTDLEATFMRMKDDHMKNGKHVRTQKI